ncbi:Dicer-like protein 1 [Microbotryomycetes sp. JL201]|nr:Dicer-like protein 1 [Microbotryomycetes sp. JL201]
MGQPPEDASSKRIEPLGRVKQAQAPPLKRHTQHVEPRQTDSTEERHLSLSLALRDREIRLRRLTTAQPTLLKPFDRATRPSIPRRLAQDAVTDQHLNLTHASTAADVVRSSLGVVAASPSTHSPGHSEDNGDSCTHSRTSSTVTAVNGVSDKSLDFDCPADSLDQQQAAGMVVSMMLSDDDSSDCCSVSDDGDLIVTYIDSTTHDMNAALVTTPLDVSATDADEFAILALGTSARAVVLAETDATLKTAHERPDTGKQANEEPLPMSKDSHAIELSSALEQAALECTEAQEGASNDAAGTVVDVDVHKVDPASTFSPTLANAAVPVLLNPVSGGQATFEGVFDPEKLSEHMAKVFSILDDDSSSASEDDEVNPSQEEHATQSSNGVSRTKKIRHISGFKIRRDGKAIDGRDDFVEIDDDVLHADRDETERITPKSYQIAILNSAKAGNVIACLPTGSGKTLIAVLLMEWMHNQIEVPRMKQGKNKRMQFFITNSVPLVHQQAKIIAHTTNLRVGKVFGALNIDLCSDEEWRYNFEHFDCLCLTAQLLLDSLAHDFIGVDEISLLVFDEAHHAKSNHPFASILRHFLNRAPPEERPKVLGMTASLVNSNEGMKEVRRLQTLFDAKLLSAPKETIEELRKMVARPTILHVLYDKAPPYQNTQLTEEILAIAKLETLPDARDTFQKYLKAAETALVDFGPDACDLMWHLFLRRYKDRYMPWNDLRENELAEGGVGGGRAAARTLTASGEVRQRGDRASKVVPVKEKDKREAMEKGRGEATTAEPLRTWSSSSRDSSEAPVDLALNRHVQSQDKDDALDIFSSKKEQNDENPAPEAEADSSKNTGPVSEPDDEQGPVTAQAGQMNASGDQTPPSTEPELEYVEMVTSPGEAPHSKTEKGKIASTTFPDEDETDNIRSLVDWPLWMECIDRHIPTLSLDRLTPKLQRLIEMLAACAPSAAIFCGIVFVKRRMDALLIAQIIKELSGYIQELSWIKVDCVTGHGNGASGVLGSQMAWARQTSILHAFKEGATNLLIATSVVEEGLDVQPCNFVARYDLYDTHISYVQSKGRARAACSHYLLFVEEDNLEEHRKLMRISQFDKEIGQMLSESGSEVPLGGEAEPDDDDGDLEIEESLTDETTRAYITPHFALSLLHRYCATLPTSDLFASNKPHFELATTEEGFACKVVLPTNAKVREVGSVVARNSKAAKRAVAIMAIRELKAADALDNHFLPIRTFKESIVRDERGRRIGSRKREVSYKHKLADVWSSSIAGTEDSATLYGAVLRVVGQPDGFHRVDEGLYRPLLLLGRARLPPTLECKLYTGTSPTTVSIVPLEGSIRVDENQRAMLSSYTRCIWTSALSRPIKLKDGESENCLFAPLVDWDESKYALEMDDMDWIAMQRAIGNRDEPVDIQNLTGIKDAVLIDEGRHNGKYYHVATRTDLNPVMEGIEGTHSVAGHKNMLEYYKMFARAVIKKREIVETQPLFEIMKVAKTVMTLAPSKTVKPPISGAEGQKASDKDPKASGRAFRKQKQTKPGKLSVKRSRNGNVAEKEKTIEAGSEKMALAEKETATNGQTSMSVDMTLIDESSVIKQTPGADSAPTNGGCATMVQVASANAEPTPTQPASVDQSQAIDEAPAKSEASGTGGQVGCLRTTSEQDPAANTVTAAMSDLHAATTTNEAVAAKQAVNNQPTSTDGVAIKDQEGPSEAKTDAAANTTLSSVVKVRSTARKSKKKKKVVVDAAEGVKRFAIPQLCKIHTVPGSIHRTLEHNLLVSELNTNWFANTFDPILVRRALITPAACMGEDYERLEILGDAALKTIASIRVCQWQATETENQIGDKTIADVVEALMGAAYETGMAKGGLSLAYDYSLQAAIAVGVPLDGIKVWDDFLKVHGPIKAPSGFQIDVSAIESKLGYKFRYPHLVQEALTHPSKINAPATFQRLEWLGDSSLDLLVIRYCWTRFGELSPGQMTDLKGAMVGNEALAAISIELGLEKYLLFDNASLARNIAVFRQKCRQLREEELALAKAEKRRVRPYWLMSDPPKAVADIVESLFGAILLDSHFDPCSVQIPFDKILDPWYTKWITLLSLKIDSARHFIERTKEAGCDDMTCSMVEVPSKVSEFGQVVPCRTRVELSGHGQTMALVTTANPKTAKRLACALALEFLDSHPDFFQDHCDCARVRAQREALASGRTDGLKSEDDESGSIDGSDAGEPETKKRKVDGPPRVPAQDEPDRL